MPATSRLIVMMEPEDKERLVAVARERNVSVAKLARERLVATTSPDEEMFLEAVVELGRRARRIFADVDAREAREAEARAAQPDREAAIRTRVEVAFEAARVRGRRSRGTDTHRRGMRT